ncbi:MAG: hypothetical protein COA45_07035 [Zetaproteobacteria bacterium]|nr:MAG: hypothetical protein COA45_07035 [Zetaproteobacteria bacterium]
MALKTRVVSFVWGFAEATFFFFVPDIWLTRIAVTDLKEAVINAFITLIGALIGGTVLYILASISFDYIRQALDFVPAISKNMIDQAGEQMQNANPVKVIIMAGFTGLPFKIYAAWSGHLALSVPVFILISAVARIGRFLFLIFVIYGTKSVLKSYMSTKNLLWLHTVLWICFYCYYFFKMGLETKM